MSSTPKYPKLVVARCSENFRNELWLIMVIRFHIIRIKLNAIRFRRRQKEKSFSVLCYRFSCICLQMSCFIYKFADAKIVH